MNTIRVKPPIKFILSFTVHIGLQEDNNWLAFNDVNDANIKRKELNNAENVNNINLSTIIGRNKKNIVMEGQL